MLSCALACVGTLAVLFSLLALVQKSLYASALCLLVVLLQIASFFYLLGAQIIAFIQVLIYAGAVMVLLVVAIMSTAEGPRWAKLGIPAWLAGFILLLPCAELAAFYRFSAPSKTFIPIIHVALERRMAEVLFGPYALMTELVGLLILIVALVPLQENS